MSFRFVAALFLYVGVCLLGKTHAQDYLKGDFHQHTTYTDGSFTIGYMMQKSNQFRLDWWANSEHGGSSVRNTIGYRSWKGKVVADNTAAKAFADLWFYSNPIFVHTIDSAK